MLTTFPYRILAAQIGGFEPRQLVLLVAAVGLLTMVLISTHRRIRASQHMPRASAHDRYLETQKHTKARAGLEQVMAELDELSRQIHGRLDIKLTRLEVATREADRRIAELSKLVQATGGRPAIEITLDPEDPHGAYATQADTDAERHGPVYRLADRGLSPIDIAQEVGMLTGEVELILALRHTRARSAAKT